MNLAGLSLGCLERIDLGTLGLVFLCNMGGKVAITIFPLDQRIRTGCAIPAGRKLRSAATSMAFLHGRVTTPAIKRTTFLSHKDTLQPFLYSCTNHRNHPLSIWCHLMILPIRSKNLGVIINLLWACQQDFGHFWQRYFARPALFIKKSLIFELRSCGVASFLHIVCGWAPARTGSCCV